MRRYGAGIFGPLVASVVPILAAGLGFYMLNWADEVYADRELPRLTAWIFDNRWLVVLMLLPAVLCGVASAFVHRRYLLYGPYLLFLFAPILLMVMAFATLIISIYAREIESAM